jgi:hypothetical protein
MTWAAVGGAVEPYILMSGRPPVDPVPGMLAAADEPEAMPAGPSGPAQPGVITAVVTAITAAGTATRPAIVPAVPRPRMLPLTAVVKGRQSPVRLLVARHEPVPLALRNPEAGVSHAQRTEDTLGVEGLPGLVGSPGDEHAEDL